MDKGKIINTLKWFAAHAAAFGGAAAAIAFAFEGDYNNAIAAFLAALAGFGLNITPSKQAAM